ncbi:proton-translocating NADH-quinone oxidoreductase, chain L [Beggiatoa alba B18LD]|uniref:Proton-translocating NADH-quinone oxidoreductase, chain L n=1 Tax=Beggiatoa alba B18LD TaxID=395493 RepID=I3CGM1_9GAMM|nr:NADH-quinone oxidoreductase subunit L [Beggiatoa alba]EIJ42764.1 proton-translocating NADH-quinone oxidoreductase, chain L [Beggiatoa alba B18LD]
MQTIYLTIVLAPLVGAITAGLFSVSRRTAHTVTILGVAIACILSIFTFKYIAIDGNEPFNQTLYTWLVSGGIRFEVGFLVDTLTATMMVVVTFVSLMVHIYTIGYMADDAGYQRFFSYISLFTFSMLMLVMSNNFLQLFFGWEAVGLVSYLLIGFWFQRDTAIYANLKAFLVNRVGDFGFLLGIAAVLMYFNSLNYAEVFAQTETFKDTTIQIIPSWDWSLMTVICILLFIGAMGKSAQVPLHVWLPDSMEGPTPISALIHAATMVTAGIFMVSRMSPLFELSETALSFVLVIGSITALFMGFLGLVQNDIKRVVAYSTLSQLGYMTVALGASAYAAGIFHLMTHAFFKALLFLAAGSVIIAMHHEQDIRKMGGLYKYMPITYITSLIGSLALIGFPGFAGFFSKDAIIEAAHHASEMGRTGAGFAYFSVLIGVFITALYSFRMFFLVFHGKERIDEHTREHLHETPAVVTLPLILLAIPSIIIGALFVEPMLYSKFFEGAIFVEETHRVFEAEEYHGVLAFIKHGMMMPPFWLAMGGLFTAAYLYLIHPQLVTRITQLSVVQKIQKVLLNKYGFDQFNEWFFAGGARHVGTWLWRFGDVKTIDGYIVNGSAKVVAWLSGTIRHVQTGLLYHYAFAMIIGLAVLLSVFVLYGTA